MMPEMDVVLTLPRILGGSTRFERWHNRTVKAVLKEEIEKHWRKRIPDHFKQNARGKYHHKPRSRRYRRIKSRRFKSRRDLVKTRVTEEKFTSRHDGIRVGGRVSSGLVVATLVMRWPFPVGKDPPKVKVTPRVMATEIEATTRGEEQNIYDGFRDRYVARFRAELSDRVRRNVNVIFT